MKIMQRLKSDKLFRMNIILLIVAILLLSNTNLKKEATQAECNVANEFVCDTEAVNLRAYTNNQCIERDLLGGVDPTAEQNCIVIDGCKIGREIDTSGGERWDSYACVNCAPSGVRVKQVSHCCSQDGFVVSDDDGYVVACKSGEPSPGSECSSSFQESLASILGSFEFAAGWNCMTRFYIVAFGGGALIAMMLMSAL